MEVTALKLSTADAKVTYGCTKTDRMEEKDKWPCNVCNKGFGRNRSISIVVG